MEIFFNLLEFCEKEILKPLRFSVHIKNFKTPPSKNSGYTPVYYVIGVGRVVLGRRDSKSEICENF